MEKAAVAVGEWRVMSVHVRVACHGVGDSGRPYYPGTTQGDKVKVLVCGCCLPDEPRSPSVCLACCLAAARGVWPRPACMHVALPAGAKLVPPR